MGRGTNDPELLWGRKIELQPCVKPKLKAIGLAISCNVRDTATIDGESHDPSRNDDEEVPNHLHA